MIRLQKSDYYIYEPTMLDNQSVCMPHCWLTRDGKFHAKAWVMGQSSGNNDIPGWVVCQDRELELQEGQFLKNFPELGQSFRLYRVPDPANIHSKLRLKANQHYCCLHYVNVQEFTPTQLASYNPGNTQTRS